MMITKYFVCLFLLLVCIPESLKAVQVEITSAEQISEEIIQLSWTVDNASEPIRYRVLYTKASTNETTYEWPAQIKRTELTDVTYSRSLVTISNFECFNECIKSIDCVGAFRVYRQANVQNCFLKTSNDSINATYVSLPDTEYAVITEYSSELDIGPIPYNEIYKFKIAIYDNNTQSWSELSDFSNIVNTTVELTFSFERTSFLTGLARITQIGKFTNYKISKHFISIIESSSFGFATGKTISKFSLQPSYYNQDFRELEYTATEADCEEKCATEDFCILYAYFNDTNEIDNLNETTCARFFNLDLDTAVYRNKAASVFSMISNSSEIELDLEINSNYKFEFSALTPYGSQIVSPTIIYYNFTDYITVNLSVSINSPELSINLNWTVENANFSLSRFQLYIKEERKSYYYLEESTDYEDPNESKLDFDDILQCYLSCYNNPDCVAYTWDGDNSVCTLKFTTENPKECDTADEGLSCFKISDYTSELMLKDKFANRKYCFELTVQTIEGYQSEKSNSQCVTLHLSVNVENSTEFIEGKTASIECLYSDINSTFIKNITWLKDGSTENIDAIRKELDFVGDKLLFRNLTRNRFDGVYECELFLYQEQYLKSLNQIQATVSFPNSLKINSNDIVRFNESDNTNISCVVDGYPKLDLVWRYNSTDIVKDVQYLNTSTTSNTLILTIENIRKTQQGSYECSTVDSKYSAKIQLIIRTVPDQPAITNATVATSNSTQIKWAITPGDEIDLTMLLLEWSKDFSDASILPYTRYFSYVDIKNEIALDLKLPNNTQLRISVFNALGQSQKSSNFILRYTESNSGGGGGGTTLAPSNKLDTSDKFLIPFILMTIFFLIASSFIIAYFIRIRIRNSKIRSRLLLVDTNMDEF